MFKVIKISNSPLYLLNELGSAFATTLNCSTKKIHANSTLKTMNYIYVLTLREDALFLRLTLISATLLRKVSKQATIIVVIDELTKLDRFPVEHALLLNLNIEIVTIKTSQADCVKSSRFLKLILPNIINDKFWFLDSDTLPLVNIDKVNIPGQIGMVRDENKDKANFGLNKSNMAKCGAMGWPVPVYPYYNTGVMLVRNSVEVKELFSRAHQFWLSACASGVVYGDQLPFNTAISISSNINISLLDDVFNAQIQPAPWLAPRAKVLHIYSGSLAKRKDTVLHMLVAELRDCGVLREDVLDNLLSSKNPWLKNSRQALLFPMRKMLGYVTN